MEKIIEIPEEVKVNQEGNKTTVSGKLGDVSRIFSHPRVSIKVDDKISITTKSERKKDCAVVGAWVAHIRNMFVGVIEGYKYKLKVVYTHFPINVKVMENKIEISNFMGEKGVRIAKIVDDSKVDIQKEMITITGINIEAVGQTAANLELACRKRGKDIRIFQDGIYILKR